jgi:hypothetical protein
MVSREVGISVIHEEGEGEASPFFLRAENSLVFAGGTAIGN